MLCSFCGIPITTSTGSTVPVTAFQSASPILTNREISTYIPSTRSGISLRYSFIPFSIALLSFSGTLPEISFTSTRISMFSPAAALFSCAGVSTAFTTAAVSDTPAVYSCSSQTTVTVTVPSPIFRAVLVSAMPFTFPVGTASPDVFALPSSVISDTSTSSLMSGCSSGVFSGLFSGVSSGFFSGVFCGLFSGLFSGVFSGFFSGVFSGFFSGVFSGFFSGVFSGFSGWTVGDGVSVPPPPGFSGSGFFIVRSKPQSLQMVSLSSSYTWLCFSSNAAHRLHTLQCPSASYT